MNFCQPIIDHARVHPDQTALVIPRMAGQRLLGEEQISFGGLASEVARYQDGLQQAGYQRGDRVVILLRPGIALYALTLALLAAGMVPVFIDTGMPRRVIRAALKASGARALVSHRALLRFAWLLPEVRGISRLAEEGAGLSYSALSTLRRRDNGVTLCDCAPTDHGLITFTSGSTGTPKGANRTHGSLVAQHSAIRRHWPDRDGDVDMPCFPVLVLHNLCCGMTTVMPRVDLAAPAGVQGSAVVEQLRRHGVTRLSGAPAFISRVADAAHERPECLGSLREVVVGGATLSLPLQQRLADTFGEDRVRVVYGSTEAEPIADATLAQMRQHGGAPGYLVGHVAEGCELVIVDTDRPLASEEDVATARLPAGAVGEILVRGDHVLKGYVDNPEADRENKIACANGLVWHRTGDTGLLDETGLLFLHGRIKDRIALNGTSVDVFPLEKPLDALPGVERACVLAHPDGNTLVVCLQCSHTLAATELEAIQAWRAALGHPRVQVYQSQLPVDRRHNSKLDRAALLDQLRRGTLKTVRIMEQGQ